MSYPIYYRSLASWIGRLGIAASAADLCDHLERYEANDPDYWAGLCREMRATPQDGDVFAGIARLCDLLRRDNPRFVPAIMTDWILEDV